MKKISVKGALKAYYYLLAIDGKIDEHEMKCFYDICLEADELSHQYLEELKAQCDDVIQSALGSEYEEIIQEAFDEAVREEDENKIPSRLLLWNMLVLANSNREYSDGERKLICHAARILNIEKSVYMEMEQMAKTAFILTKEREQYEESERAYRVIRPIVVELEKRIEVILRAAKCLITDEVEVDEPYTEEEKQNVIVDVMSDVMSNAGSVLSDTAVHAGNKIGSFLKGIKKTKLDNKEEK